MNIYALKGHKVQVDTFEAGYEYEQVKARSLLNIDTTYTVLSTTVDSWSTAVVLEEFPDETFNSVFFKDVITQSEGDNKKHTDFDKYNSNKMDTLKTILVTDHNDFEGEDFSFIIEVTDRQLESIKKEINSEEYDGSFSLIENRVYTDEYIEMTNEMSNNNYMDRIGRYKLLDIEFDEPINWYEDVFYKGVGLKRI